MKYSFLIQVLLICLLLTLFAAFADSTNYATDYSLPFPVKKHFKSASYKGHSSTGISISPAMGTVFYSSAYNSRINNRYAVSALFEIPITGVISTEIEGCYSASQIQYVNAIKSFSQYGGGADLKYYLTRGTSLRPYVGGGLTAFRYEGLESFGNSYDLWLGGTQVVAGTDLALTEEVALGFRGGWVLPVFRRPLATPYGDLPGYEEYVATGSQFYRLMGSVKMSF